MTLIRHKVFLAAYCMRAMSQCSCFLPDVTRKLINSDTAGADFVPLFNIGCNYHDVRPDNL